MRLTLIDKHISKLLCLLAGMIIFAHSVIPHNHDYNNLESYIEYLLPDSEGQYNDNDSCHFLNKLFSEESKESIVKSNIVIHYNIDLLNIESSSKNVLPLNIKKGISSHFPHSKQVLLDHYTLRGPPMLA